MVAGIAAQSFLDNFNTVDNDPSAYSLQKVVIVLLEFHVRSYKENVSCGSGLCWKAASLFYIENLKLLLISVLGPLAFSVIK